MVSRAGLGRATAALTGAFGVAVAVSSYGNGIGWSSAGVEAGTFPFAIGIVLAATSAFNLLAAGRHPAAVARVIGWDDLRKLAGLFLPAVVLVAAVPILGMHVASGLYVLGILAWQNHVPVWKAAVAATLVTATLYLLFDLLFQVSLPLGMLGAAFGY